MLRSLGSSHGPVVNLRPLRTREFSVELQKSGPAQLAAGYRSFALITVYLGSGTVVRWEEWGEWTEIQFSAGECSIRPEGPGGVVEWPVGAKCLHVHVRPCRMRHLGVREVGETHTALRTERQLRDPIIGDIGARLHRALGARARDERAMSSMLEALFRHVGRAYSAPAPPPVRVGRLELPQVLEILRGSIRCWEGVATVAERAGLTRSHFSRRIGALTGLSPYAYVRACRIEASKHLLEETPLDLSAIAYRTGYSDQSHLTRLFRHATCMTPAQHRVECASLRDG